VKSDPDYGRLSHQSPDDLQAGSRVEVGIEKEHPLDFALWKAAKPGEPWWESPWGKGRPGWHIECSAMSMRYLGETLDIHGGGQDLIFPHHENEIAQSEGFTGVTPFVKYWLHNGFVQLGGEKMSKSLGIFVALKQALDRFSPDAIRLFILSSHYRSPINFSEEGVAAAEKGVERLRQAAFADSQRGMEDSSMEAPARLYDVTDDTDPFRQRFIEAMDHDFNSPQALAALFDLARDINRTMDQGADPRGAQQTLRELAGVLGFSFEKPEVDLAAKPFIDLLISIRTEARKDKQWQMADRIRISLKDLGVVLEDTPQGTVWKQEKAST
jgi:cysteinyl-tRNA synthetase